MNKQTCKQCQHSTPNTVTLLDGRTVKAEYGLVDCSAVVSRVGFYPNDRNFCNYFKVNDDI